MRIKLIALLTLITTFGIKAQLIEQNHFDITKNLDIYNSLFKELVMNYVDSIEIEKTIQTNINDLLRRLDPYTEYIPQEEMLDFTFMTTGEYGGVGSIISMKDKDILIREPYENMPAAKAGLRPGDKLLEVNGVDLTNKTTSDASELLKGTPNTKVKIKYLRAGETKPKEVTLERQRIHIDPITYYGVLNDGVGYIHLSSFTTDAAQSFKNAFLDLKNNHAISSLVIDVRDNGGGVVEECLEMLNLFLPKGELLLSMKGKTPQSERIYRATQDALDLALPLVVLVNEGSASASEILAGGIQDYDRGVIVGTRTFGKGLVQGTRSLPYDGRIKLTTAKYYIPSGRSIQAIDYAHRDEFGYVTYIPDSLTTEYHTTAGRPVRDGRGILPDYIVEEEKIPTILYYMEASQLFFNFVVDWRIKNPVIASPQEFVLSNDTYEAFKEYVRTQNFTYDLNSEKRMESLKKMMEFEGYWDTASEQFEALEALLKPNLERDLEIYRKQISKYLSYEIMKQYYFAKGQLIYALRDDTQFNKALEIILQPSLYQSTLTPNLKD